MILVRALTALARPALAAGAIAASAGGAWFAVDRLRADPGPTPFAALQGQGQRVLLAEFGEDADALVAVDPADPSSRTGLATVDHARGFGTFAALSPDGRAVAYTALPADAVQPSTGTPATAAIVDTDGNVTELADDVDLLVTPVWAPDSASVIVRRNTPCDPASCGDGGAGSFELLSLARDGTQTPITTWRSAAPFPIAFSPDGSRLYFATVSPDGTDLYSVAPDGSGETRIAHLSDDIARDWRLSPDGASIAFAAAESGASPQVVARRVDLATGEVSDAIDALAAGPPSTGIARGEFNPVWRPDGTLAVGALNLDGGASAVAVVDGATSRVTASTDRLDLPLDVSPDGRYLIVRSVEGRTPFEAGATRLDLIDAGGARVTLSNSADVLVIGWLR